MKSILKEETGKGFKKRTMHNEFEDDGYDSATEEDIVL